MSVSKTEKARSSFANPDLSSLSQLLTSMVHFMAVVFLAIWEKIGLRLTHCTDGEAPAGELHAFVRGGLGPHLPEGGQVHFLLLFSINYKAVVISTPSGFWGFGVLGF